MSFFILLFILLAVEKTVGPLSPIYLQKIQLPIQCVGSLNKTEQNLSVQSKQKITIGPKLSANVEKRTLSSAESQKSVSAVSSMEQIVAEPNAAFPLVLPHEKMSQKSDGIFREFSLSAQQKENSLGHYLAELSNYYLSAKMPISPYTIARVLLRMQNALKYYAFDKRQYSFAELPYPLTLENFRVEKNSHDFSGMSGNVNVSFIAKCKICSKNELTPNKMMTMSPQQISEMRLNSDKSDIAWFLGSVIHLLVYQSYPLEEWGRRNGIFANYGQFEGNLENPQFLQDFQSLHMDLLQKNVKKMLLSDEQIKIRNDFPRGYDKAYDVLGPIINNALQIDPKMRTFDKNGQLLKLISLAF